MVDGLGTTLVAAFLPGGAQSQVRKVPVPKDHRLIISEVTELQEDDGHRRSCV